jgi:hypothetical protein
LQYHLEVIKLQKQHKDMTYACLVSAVIYFFCIIHQFQLTFAFAPKRNGISSCVIPPVIQDPISSQTTTFTNIGAELFGISNVKQCEVRTSPNCIFPQWDPKMHKWDDGGFCMEETLTGGACIGDIDGNGYDDIYYARLDGTDKLFLNDANGKFIDATASAGLDRPHLKSNGCYIFDIDNDGDNDIYVSTMGNKQFYLYVNQDGEGHFKEEAKERGLDNMKTYGRKTAGFSIAISDYDLDGDLDVITTEWFPWLDHVEHEHEQSMKIDFHNATNARFFENLGPSKLGYFREVTDGAGIRGDIRVRNRITRLIHSACEVIKTDELKELLQYLGEPVEDSMDEEDLHVIFEDLVKLWKNGLMQTRRISSDKDKESTPYGKYVYMVIPPRFIQSSSSIKIVLLPHKNGGPVQLFIGGKSNPNPTSRRNKHLFKTRPIHQGQQGTLKIDVGSAYGVKVLNIGIKCLNKSSDGECNFDVLFLPVSKIPDDPNKFNCAARRKMAGYAAMLKKENFDGSLKHASNMIKSHRVAGQGVKQVGVFRVDLVSPWIASEVFFKYAVDRMRLLKYDVSTVRQQMRKLLQFGKNLDISKEERMIRTENRLKQNVAKKLPGANEHNWHEVLQVAMDAKRETKQIKSKSKHYDAFGVRHDDTALNGGLNHAFDLPLVGAFQFAAKFSDLDQDGFPDLVISGDFGTSQLYYNNGDKTFVHGNFHLVEDMLDNSMGCTVGDWDMDGKLDVMFTSASISEVDLDDLNQIATTAGMLLNFRGNHLYRNLGERLFEDVTDVSNVRESGWGWGAFLFDFDNDGDLDALNGNGMDDPETTDDDWAVHQKMKLYVNQGYDENFKMVDEATLRGIKNTKENRGAMTFDYDNDGDLDVFVVNHAEAPSFYRNDGGNYYDFIRIKVYERVGGRESIGATVFLQLNEEDETEQIREIGSTAAFLGQGESVAHFGLGLRGIDELVYKVRVQYFTTPDEGYDTNLNSTAIKHNLEFYNVQPRSTLIVYKTDTREMLKNNNDVSNKNKFPICDQTGGKIRETSVLLEEAKRARVTRKITTGKIEL